MRLHALAAPLFRALDRRWTILRRERVPQIGLLSAAVLVVGATTVYLIEQRTPDANIGSLREALWYGIVTMTTVGYGDYTPKTTVGRMAGAILALGGMTLLSLFTATIASVLVAQKIKEGRGLETIKGRDHVLICGWNQYAERVLDGLIAATRRDPIVLVNELPEDTVGDLLTRYHGKDVRFVRGDPAVEAVLTRANVRQARAAIVVADTSRGLPTASDERTALVTLALKSLKPEIKVTAEAVDMKGEAHLRRAGADDIIISGEFNGFLLSSAAEAPGISHVARRLLSLSGTELRRVPLPPEFVGRTFGELFQALRGRDGFLTLAIVAERQGLTLDDLLTDDFSLVDQFIKQQFTEAGKEYLRFEEGVDRVLVNPPDSYVISRGDLAIGIPRGE